MWRPIAERDRTCPPRSAAGADNPRRIRKRDAGCGDKRAPQACIRSSRRSWSTSSAWRVKVQRTRCAGTGKQERRCGVWMRSAIVHGRLGQQREQITRAGSGNAMLVMTPKRAPQACIRSSRRSWPISSAWQAKRQRTRCVGTSGQARCCGVQLRIASVRGRSLRGGRLRENRREVCLIFWFQR